MELEYGLVVYLDEDLPLFLLAGAVKCSLSWSFESHSVSDPVMGNRVCQDFIELDLKREERRVVQLRRESFINESRLTERRRERKIRLKTGKRISQMI